MQKINEHAYAIMPEDGKACQVVGDTVTIKARSGETGGSYSVVEIKSLPQGGPPLHQHSREDEISFVLEGDYEFQIGERIIHATQGSWVLAPRGLPHSTKNISAAPGRLLVMWVPGGVEGFFAEVDGLTDLQRVVTIGGRYGLEFLPAARAEQAA